MTTISSADLRDALEAIRRAADSRQVTAETEALVRRVLPLRWFSPAEVEAALQDLRRLCGGSQGGVSQPTTKAKEA